MSNNNDKKSPIIILLLVIKDLLLATVLIFKEIGDLVILTFSLFASFFYSTYKIILYFIKSIFNPIQGIINAFSGTIHSIKFNTALNHAPAKKKGRPKKFRLSLPKIRLSRRIKILLLKSQFFLLGSLTFAAIIIFNQMNFFIKNLPNPKLLTVDGYKATTNIYDRYGKLLYQIYGDENRQPVEFKDIPQKIIHATIATEDNEFFLHNGFSIRGIARAVYNNMTTDNLEGGSTITQQLIRSAYLTPEKTFYRKFKEIILAIWTEQIYTKNQILEMYLNQVPYGGTAWGIKAAAQTYFGKDVNEVSLAESAFLAGLPAAPSRYSPYGMNPLDYKKRQQEVLLRMFKEGYINNTELETAKNETLKFKSTRMPIAAPHFVMYVKDQLEKHYGPRLTESGGLRVITTLNLKLNEEIQKIVTEEVSMLGNLNVTNGAAVVTDPGKGEILAMVGSKDYFDTEADGNVNVALSLRQPGSSIKVVNYAAALEEGFTAASIIDDSPVTYQGTGQSYSPVNYDGRFHGQVTLRTALASSYNIPAVKILSSIGIKRMVEQGKKMGVKSWTDPDRFGLSLTLGGGEVTMLDMSRVYGTIANYGKREDLTPFISITDQKGNKLPLPKKEFNIQAISPEIAFILTDILADNLARSPAFGLTSSLYLPGIATAVKTGTSDSKRDNWTIGYTADYVAAVWVGNNDNTPMHPRLTSGVTGAAPIWNSIMKLLTKNSTGINWIKPDALVTVSCGLRQEYFIKGTLPAKPCPRYSSPTPALPEN
ncbi:MAG: penicillin-binding protein [Candidatus Gottesmanbacteria bacterium GW2011_GWA2_43_14]|uniref:Penicillin-binding protein n=1 Tax=Candidatus Gottesmanbacteria bacterium GW2011_GWA2_43_14 TaxID=1618443 RepID=A0A0G1DJM7_9BACT|nr:MAG: penicillin-binding protein [Candidatus Gottesmanbacteria bacterium GW2011_GWA2_43_14]